VSNRKYENFLFYIAVGEFQVLAHFRDFEARNVISEKGFRRKKLMEDSISG
jgi:hypothetical protein